MKGRESRGRVWHPHTTGQEKRCNKSKRYESNPHTPRQQVAMMRVVASWVFLAPKYLTIAPPLQRSKPPQSNHCLGVFFSPIRCIAVCIPASSSFSFFQTQSPPGQIPKAQQRRGARPLRPLRPAPRMPLADTLSVTSYHRVLDGYLGEWCLAGGRGVDGVAHNSSTSPSPPPIEQYNDSRIVQLDS